VNEQNLKNSQFDHRTLYDNDLELNKNYKTIYKNYSDLQFSNLALQHSSKIAVKLCSTVNRLRSQAIPSHPAISISDPDLEDSLSRFTTSFLPRHGLQRIRVLLSRRQQLTNSQQQTKSTPRKLGGCVHTLSTSNAPTRTFNVRLLGCQLLKQQTRSVHQHNNFARHDRPLYLSPARLRLPRRYENATRGRGQLAQQ
jgi:hypothetical protein